MTRGSGIPREETDRRHEQGTAAAWSAAHLRRLNRARLVIGTAEHTLLDAIPTISPVMAVVSAAAIVLAIALSKRRRRNRPQRTLSC